MSLKKILIIAGPTASGKSRLALYLAQKYNGIIINADALQLYKYIPIISAQPSEEDLLSAEHRLYSILEPDKLHSVGSFLKLAINEINNSFDQNKLPIIVGGTGLYIRSLIYGLAEIPEISQNIREEVRNQYNIIGAELFYDYLVKLDPKVMGIIRNTDKQRMMRALEVVKQTDKSIIDWQKHEAVSYYDKKQFTQIILMPERNYLYNNCNIRFSHMIKKGALIEIKNLVEKNIKIDAIKKAIGVMEIIQYMESIIELSELIALGQQRTRNYAKRQITWFRHQLPEAIYISYSNYDELINVIRNTKLL
ncbi:MAG: tRNA (adenosine(37)-N6)-dimethylallyltransferase MiaA [Rickettsiales endosymbiont of Dermacentor nuttalli]